MLIVLCLLFAFLLLSGIPIYLTLGLTTMIMVAFYSPVSVALLPENMYNSLGSFILLAVPFFTLAAQFMVRGGSSRYLINLANSLVGHLCGGLAIVGVLSCMFFAAISGSSVATALSMGVIIIPTMLRLGYSPSFATGVVASAGTMGIMIPPSISFILYGVLVEESIPRLFLGGVFPGLLQGALYMTWIYIYSKKKGYSGGEKAGRRDILSHTVKALPAISLPVIVLGGIYSGIVTVTEAAALAAGASLIIAVFIYREISICEIIPVSADAMKLAGMIMIIISTAIIFGHWITLSGLTTDLVSFIEKLKLPSWGFLLLFLGMFLEVASILLITVPILFPVVRHLGIDPIHFGVMMVANMEIALITPPVGLNLFVISGAAKVPLNDITRGALPFVFLGLIELAILVFWPEFILFLPNLLMPQ
jgi:C4-dicarboxylate transporter DctM subunit